MMRDALRGCRADFTDARIHLSTSPHSVTGLMLNVYSYCKDTIAQIFWRLVEAAEYLADANFFEYFRLPSFWADQDVFRSERALQDAVVEVTLVGFDPEASHRQRLEV